MSRSFVIILSVLLLSLVASAQDAEFRFTANGYKDGYWPILLDENLNPVNCARKAVLFKYCFFENGVNTWFIPENRRQTTCKIVESDTIPVIDLFIDQEAPSPIDGKFIQLTEDGVLLSECHFQNGHQIFGYKAWPAHRRYLTMDIDFDSPFVKHPNGYEMKTWQTGTGTYMGHYLIDTLQGQWMQIPLDYQRHAQSESAVEYCTFWSKRTSDEYFQTIDVVFDDEIFVNINEGGYRKFWADRSYATFKVYVNGNLHSEGDIPTGMMGIQVVGENMNEVELKFMSAEKALSVARDQQLIWQFSPPEGRFDLKPLPLQKEKRYSKRGQRREIRKAKALLSGAK